MFFVLTTKSQQPDTLTVGYNPSPPFLMKENGVTMTTVGYGDKSPKTVGGRIVALVWMFTAVMIISGFTASIASSLTVNQIGSSKYDIQDYKESQLGTIGESGSDRWLRDNFFPHKTTYSSMNQLVEAFKK